MMSDSDSTGMVPLESEAEAQAETGAEAETGAQTPSRTVAIHTHGCKLNQADTQALARRFSEAGFTVVEPTDGADIVVLNSCTVTATADAKARQFLRAARRRNPNAVVVATGCYAQRAPADLEKMPEVSLVIGNTGKPSLVESAKSTLQSHTQVSVPLPSGGPKAAGRTRSMVKIQEGCDQVCAYCIVPKVRGRERSIPPETIIAEIGKQVSESCREVVLTGTQLGTYGFDLNGVNLEGLLERILSETSVERLRVSSLQAHEITRSLLELWSDRRLMPHFHIPLQSGSDSLLRAMRRRYDSRQFAWAVDRVRGMLPDAGVTTDLIVGFPGETGEDFAVSFNFAREMRFSDIHAFPYSKRPGTSAVHFNGQVGDAEKRERMAQVLELSSGSRASFREGQLGTVRQVLWERTSANASIWTGLTDNYLRVRASSESPLSNEITDVRLTGSEGDWVVAEVLPVSPPTIPVRK